MIIFKGTSSNNDNPTNTSIPVPHEQTNGDNNANIDGKGNDYDDEIANDILVLSNAFHAAQDEDVNNALTLLTTTPSHTTADASASSSSLCYYGISATWFRNAIPYLMYRFRPDGVTTMSTNWKEQIGPMDNTQVLEYLEEEDNTNQQKQSEPNSFLFPEQVVLVGGNVWLLLSKKFGTTGPAALPLPVQYQHHRPLHTAPWVVRLSATRPPVPIPFNGRFPYEQILAPPTSASAQNLVEKEARNHNDDDDDAMPYTALQILNDSDRESDKEEDDELEDLFPGIQDSDPDPLGAHFVSNMEEYSDNNDDIGTDDHHGLNCNGGNPNDDGPILLLPASTTSTTNTARFRNIDTEYGMQAADDNDEKFDDFENQSSTVASDTTLRLVRRRYGSGLGNLGNTCYMNSTLQCLAHTEPLFRYFLTGEFQNDLNRDNPLGTGGKLAIQFAHLLAEMWGSKQLVRRGTEIPAFASDSGNDFLFSSSAPTVYPRQFKETLGNHAEQFRGYEQHDSQELAACLLDALHEDCNRVTQKPYVEKPEQAEHETDQEAADKAWQLHLQREDSRVLENFMGQIKSRLQCNTEGCGRVSTTFDPFMYLSVPIPGSENRRLIVTFVPLDPDRRPVKLAVYVNKTAALEDLMRVAFHELSKAGISPPALEDVVACDMWQGNVFKWFDLSKNSVEDIRDSDETFIYELRPLSEVRQVEENMARSSDGSGTDSATAESLGIRDIKRTKLYQLDVGTLAQVNVGDAWLSKLEHYAKNPLHITNAFNPRKGTADERVRIYRRLSNFIDSCHQAIAEHEGAISRKQAVEDLDENGHATANGTSNGMGNISMVMEMEYNPGIVGKCDISQFRNVESKKDVAILEFLAGKVYQKIMEMERQRKDVFPDGVFLELRFRKGIRAAAAPLVVRVPSTTTVFDLRNLITHRLSRSFNADSQRDFATDTKGFDPAPPVAAASATIIGDTDNVPTTDTTSPGTWVMRRVPLSYEVKSNGTSNRSGKQLGSIPQASSFSSDRRKHFTVYADPDHPEERESVAQIVGDYGTVCVDVSDDISVYVDMAELEAVDVLKQSEEEKKTDGISVLDCIEKFCLTEQLEETEQWYCSKCKEFVCAWKQTHIYRSPPYLIIHLKRFQFTHRTHRRSKISEFVDFPLEGLDLTQQVLRWSDDDKPIYDCYAVSNHYGGLGGGHYTAHCLHDDGVWCYYDDSRITQNVDPKEVVTDAAYVLYYRRRDLPISPPFELKVPTPEIVGPGPALIEDLLADSTAASADPASEMSSSANMVVDEEDGAMDVTVLYDSAGHDESRSTSPASDNAAPDEYSYDDLSSHGDADESSIGGSEMLVLQ